MKADTHQKKSDVKKAAPKRARPAKGAGRKAGYQHYKDQGREIVNKIKKVLKHLKATKNKDAQAKETLKKLRA